VNPIGFSMIAAQCKPGRWKKKKEERGNFPVRSFVLSQSSRAGAEVLGRGEKR
jgi:hypothetical protein